MRARLLRALAHLKAAQRHLEAAGRLINRCYVGGLEREAIDPVLVAVKDGREKVRRRLAEAIDNYLKPVEKTP